MLPDKETLEKINEQWLKRPPTLCALPNFAIDESKEKYSLKGKVREVREYRDLNLNSVYFFKKNGDVEYVFFLDENNSLKHKYKLENDGDFIKNLISYKYGIYKEPYNEYEYNKNRLVISNKFRGDLLHEYKYDINNKLISIKSPDFSNRRYLYDKNGFLCEELLVSKTNHPNYPIVKRLNKFKTNSLGLIIQIIEFDIVSKQNLYTKKFIRNSQGDIIEEKGISTDGMTSNKEQYEYEYDKYNNWIVKTQVGYPIVTREIDYYI